MTLSSPCESLSSLPPVTIFYRNVRWTDLEHQQDILVKQVMKNGSRRFLLLSEPLPTYTFGRSADEKDRLWSTSRIQEQGADIFPVTRGGKWTYHGPGQIVLYPILALETMGLESRAVLKFVHLIRDSVVSFLAHLGISVTCRPRPLGLYHIDRKLVSFGFCISRGVVSGGLALYYKDQSSPFQAIHPCGIAGERVTSMEEILSSLPSWNDIALGLSEHVKRSFINTVRLLS